ncbi:hypothetical protein H310_09066 [Aphanomyces invadans]|uniref:DOMON domain-containing protein n=1 Tax=Aphanomyces invadans TaxID=157072 RepID=A0A024TW62_9STRA|nr:hypothetical protein H310_09066 [Aphanomyces invadans]ETV98375.1 hypothetical protein H310_09066 [Aphanomyces invadans]|eukprot:XP_008873250.1 hypothetical protein H310_09066 [Aphanomyces invadans]
MINSPTNNALVYLVHNASAHLFDLKDSAMDSVVFAATQTSVRVVSSSNVDGIVTVTFQRRLEAVGPTDVAISTTGPTILNWAIGFTTFPDYHDVQGSASISFGTPLSPPPCTKEVLNGSPMDLGPISLKSAVLGPFACFQVTVQYPNATWFALAIAPTTNMINTPANNAIVFHTTNGTAALYDLLDSAPDSVLYQPNQSSLRVIEASVVSGTVLVVFQRPLAATVPTDVAISTTEANIVNWAVGTTTWPDYHDIQGSATIRFSSISAVTTPASPAAPALVPTYTFWIAAATFILIASLGVVVTHSVGSSFRWAKHQRLTAPPSGAASIWSAFVRTLADITFGELVVVIIYLLAFVVVGISVRIQFPTVAAARAVALISGHTSLLSLTFMLLPVARGAHWEWLFGASHDRLIKLHRWLGRLFVLTATLHLAMNVPLITFAHSFGTQAVVPLFGFVAYVSFASMALLSYESIRRHYFEVFYYYHRIMSIVGLVFVVLHTEAVRTAMMLPLALYAATFVWRLRGYLNKYSARIQSSHVPNTVILVLPVTPQTKRWAATMNPCSFFWVNIPSVSVLQWHPFSAVVTPDGESIAFCMKSLAAGSFADQVVAQAKANLVSMAVFVGGPYGKPSVDFTKYDEVILIAGGIGVTPFVSLVNQLPHTLPAHANTHIQFHWIVRSAEELLAAETLMFAAPVPTFVTARYYVDGSHADGSIVATAGQSLQYSGGRPNLDEIVHADLYEGKTVCVLVCGPPGLTHSVQLRAYNARFDFHKEVFEY